MRACIEGPSPSAESVRVLDLSQKLPRQHRVYGFPVASSLPGEAMADSFIFQIDWIIVSAMIGLLVALIGAFLYPRRDLD